MNADRHALNAALEYAAKQEQEIQHLHRRLAETREENRVLLRQVSKVRDVIDPIGPRQRTNECGDQPSMTQAPSRPADEDEF